jgi:hypothetical protein
MLQFGQNILSVNRSISLSFWLDNLSTASRFPSPHREEFFFFFDVISIFESQVFSTFETEADSHDLSIT